MSQQFCILVTASPLKTQAHLTAIRFIRELTQQKSSIRSVFFYQDAVLVANRFSAPPSDEPQLCHEWQAIAENLGIELQTCVAASYRRGVIDRHQANELAFETSNLHDQFKITGLGQLAAAMSDTKVKLIHFK